MGRRQIEVLSKLGLTASYHTILNVIKKQSEQAAIRVTAMGQDGACVTAYDNFEQIEGVKEQRIDHQATFHSVTTGQVLQGIEMSSSGLQQHMLNLQVELQTIEIFISPGNQDDSIERQVSLHIQICLKSCL